MKNILFSLFLLIFTQIACAQLTETEAQSMAQDEEKLYNTAGVDVRPDFPGGLSEFYSYIARNYWVPNMKNLNGRVFVNFVIEKDGSINDIKVIRDIGSGTGEEAIRVLQKCPKWIPGSQNGKNVRVQYSLPIKIGS